MNGIKFGEVHSFEDLNLILSKVDLPPATVKTTYVDNPGGDGSWDLTEANGKVNYKDRPAKFTFSVLPEDDFEAKKTEVSNLLNGKRFKITLDKDPEYYWDGRCTVNQYESNKKIRKIVVGATVAPYKLKQEKTRVFVPFCGKNLFDKNNLPLVYGGYGCTLSTLGSGVRLSWTDGQWTIYVAKLYPIQMLIGKTITLSANIAAVGGVTPRIAIGYVSADGSRRFNDTFLKSTGSVAFTIGEDAAAYDNLGIWLYANAGADPSTVSAGAYIDYTNITIELGNTLAERRNILPFPYPENMVTGEGVTFTAHADGGISVTGTATGQKNFSLYYGDLLADGNITFSLSGEFENLTAVIVLRDEEKNTLLNRNVETSFTFNVADYPTATKMEIVIKRKINAEVSGTVYPQLEKGAVATEYSFVPFVPYSEDQAEVEITLSNGRKTVSPTIICTGEANINVGGAEFSLGEGTHKVLGFLLEEGETAVTVSGTGSAVIVYQEGDL